jgi:aminoglycoside 2''-phosphotransferase
MEEQLAPYAAHIQAPYPALSVATVRRLGEGQNNDVLVVNGALIFRFPRYAQGIAALEREVTILRALQGRLPLAIPTPRYVALTPRLVGRVFMGYPLLPGAPLEPTVLAHLDEAEVATLARGLGDFLRHLHQIRLEEVLPGAAAQPDLRASWADLYARIQRHLFPAMRPEARAWAAAHFETFLHSPQSRAISPVLTHGDLGVGNVLYEAQRHRVTGIIDFSGAGPQDAAVDLAALSTLRAGVLDEVAHTYPVTQALLDRAAFYRGTFALQEALFGVENDDEDAFRAGIAAYV